MDLYEYHPAEQLYQDYNSRMSSIKEEGIDVEDQPKQAAGDQGLTADQTQFSVDYTVDQDSKWNSPVDRPENRKVTRVSVNRAPDRLARKHKGDQKTESLSRSTGNINLTKRSTARCVSAISNSH